MEKVYIASPFFNEFEVLVRDRMCKQLQSYELLRPDQTDASKTYAKKTGDERKKWAKEIFHENVKMIESCDILCFPEYTDDLGTLFEVGYAMGKHKRVKRYNYLTDELTDINYPVISLDITDREVVPIEGSISAVEFGLRYSLLNKEICYTMRPGMKRNVMFSANFIELDKNGNIIEPDWMEVL